MSKDNNLDQIELPEMSADMDADAEGRYKDLKEKLDAYLNQFDELLRR